jgi:hypothetical protein
MASKPITQRYRACKNCTVSFAYDVGKGRDRQHCTAWCRIEHQLRRRANRQREQCKVDCCEQLACRVSHQLCEKHYGRMRRGVSMADQPVLGRYRTGAGYIKILDRDHPLADMNGHLAEHRQVMHAAHDGVCPSCYWCGQPLQWKAAVVDHLNEVKDDNEPSNLVVSCNGCNRARGQIKPFIAGLTAEGLAAFINVLPLMRSS